MCVGSRRSTSFVVLFIYSYNTKKILKYLTRLMQIKTDREG